VSGGKQIDSLLQAKGIVVVVVVDYRWLKRNLLGVT
jgi:hypothetical protein